MTLLVQLMISACLAQSLGLRWAPEDPRLTAVSNALTQKIARMPRMLSMALRLLFGAFAAWARWRVGKPINRMMPKDMGRCMDQWREAPIGPARELILFVERMSMFLVFSLYPQEVQGERGDFRVRGDASSLWP